MCMNVYFYHMNLWDVWERAANMKNASHGPLRKHCVWDGVEARVSLYALQPLLIVRCIVYHFITQKTAYERQFNEKSLSIVWMEECIVQPPFCALLCETFQYRFTTMSQKRWKYEIQFIHESLCIQARVYVQMEFGCGSLEDFILM